MMINKATNATNILTILVNIAVFYCILFPADMVNIKEILFVIPILFYFVISKDNRVIPLYIFFYGIFYTVIAIVYSLIRGTDVSGAISYGYVWLFLLLIPLTARYSIDIKKCFFFATYIVAIIIDFIFVTDALGIISISTNPVALFLLNINELQGLGKGIFSTFGYSIYYKSCALILITYGYFIFKRKYIASIPLIVSMLACGTRANFIVALFITVAIPILCNDTPSKRAIAFLVIFTAGIALLPSLFDKMIALNNLKFNRSGSIKWADVAVIVKNMNNNIVNFLLGTGVGSVFYSPRGQLMRTFEFSYVDYMRQTGLFGMLIFASFIIRPMKWLFNNEKWLFISFIGFLLVAATNPLLVTSTSFMLYVLIYHDYECAKRPITYYSYENEIA